MALGRPGRSSAPAPRGPRCPGRAALTCPARGRDARKLGAGQEMVSERGPGRDREGLAPTGQNRLPAAAGPGVPAPGGPDPSLRPRLGPRGLSPGPAPPRGQPRGVGAGEERAETCRALGSGDPLAGPRPQGTPVLSPGTRVRRDAAPGALAASCTARAGGGRRPWSGGTSGARPRGRETPRTRVRLRPSRSSLSAASGVRSRPARPANGARVSEAEERS